jgi:hypothetical protein
LHALIIERFHKKALVKLKNSNSEKKRSYKCNKALNYTLTLFALIPIFALALSYAYAIVATGIIFIDIVFKTKPWYWQTLAFLLGGCVFIF